MKVQARPKQQPGREPAALPRHMAAGKVLQPAQIERQNRQTAVKKRKLSTLLAVQAVFWAPVLEGEERLKNAPKTEKGLHLAAEGRSRTAV